MTTDYVDFASLVQNEIPMNFLSGFVKDIPYVYRSAQTFMEDNFDTEFGIDVLPYHRRAKVDELLIRIAEQYNLKSSTRFNAANNCRHARVESGLFILTSSFVNHPEKLVRKAEFRDTYARCNQLTLFSEWDDRPKGNFYYAILLHGTKGINTTECGFVRLAIPSYDSKAYLYNIDLIEYCNGNGSYTNANEIEDKTDARLKDNIIRKQN